MTSHTTQDSQHHQVWGWNKVDNSPYHSVYWHVHHTAWTLLTHVILYTDVSSTVLCTTYAETMDQCFRNCVKTNCCKLLGDFRAGQYEPASSAIKLLTNAISVLYVYISQKKSSPRRVWQCCHKTKLSVIWGAGRIRIFNMLHLKMSDTRPWCGYNCCKQRCLLASLW